MLMQLTTTEPVSDEERRRQVDRVLSSSNEARLNRIVELFRHNKPYTPPSMLETSIPRNKKKLPGKVPGTTAGRGGHIPVRCGKYQLQEAIATRARREARREAFKAGRQAPEPETS